MRPKRLLMRAHPSLGIGIHLDFGEWAYRAGKWVRVYAVVDEEDATAVDREIASQMAAFRGLIGRDPTHIDSHQHRHRIEPARSILARVARPLSIPVRDADARVRYCGSFYGQLGDGTPWPEGITADALIAILNSLKPGFTELGCHPAAEADLDTMYRFERLQELASLCDARVRAAMNVAGIELCSFRTLDTTGAV